jgi:rfaE bifunctional protein nucleotidyltransferase chain/domain
LAGTEKRTVAEPIYLNKIKTHDELLALLEQAKREHKRIVFANGCFDVLHAGHVSYLEDAAAQGDLLVVAVNSDDSTRALKGPDRPCYPQQQRLELLAAMEMVDFVVCFDDPTVAPLLERLRPHVHAKGTDYTRETVPERDTALALGIEIYIAGDPKENASRQIIGRIREEGAAT